MTVKALARRDGNTPATVETGAGDFYASSPRIDVLQLIQVFTGQLVSLTEAPDKPT